MFTITIVVSTALFGVFVLILLYFVVAVALAYRTIKCSSLYYA